MMKHLVLTSILYIAISAALIAQPAGTNLPPNGEPGKCYAKCMMPDRIDTIQTDYPIYIGVDTTKVKLSVVTLMDEPAVFEWRTRKKKNCISTDAEKCLENYQAEVTPAVYTDYLVAKRPNKVPEEDLHYRTIVSIVERKGGYTEWHEVLCGNHVSKKLIRQVREKLQDNGYELTDFGLMDKEFKLALRTYQEQHSLPIGQLDIQTLKSLDVNYRR